jgi:L-malate glycosyltransferase
MIRVLKVVPTLLCGGTESQVMTLGRALDPAAFQLEVACLRRWGPFVQELAERRIPLFEYPIPRFMSAKAIVQQARFARGVSRRRIDIVHSYNFYGNVFAVPPARLTASVVIASIRDRGPYLTSLQKRVQRHACRLADCVLVNADAVRDWLVSDGYDPSRIVVIRNGVDLSRFTPPTSRGWLHRELGWPPDAPIVGVVSRLSRLKGLEQFLDAAAVVAQRFPAARFLVAGETNPLEREYLAELQSRASALGIGGRVVFTGLRSDVPAILFSLSVSVMPSLNEALSNSLLESLAAGAPVVATRVGGTPEALDDGVNGLLVPPDDTRALALAICRLLEDRSLADTLGRTARQSIIDRFSVERMVRTTEQLYAALLGKRSRIGSIQTPELACK